VPRRNGREPSAADRARCLSGNSRRLGESAVGAAGCIFRPWSHFKRLRWCKNETAPQTQPKDDLSELKGRPCLWGSARHLDAVGQRPRTWNRAAENACDSTQNYLPSTNLCPKHAPPGRTCVIPSALICSSPAPKRPLVQHWCSGRTRQPLCLNLVQELQIAQNKRTRIAWGCCRSREATGESAVAPSHRHGPTRKVRFHCVSEWDDEFITKVTRGIDSLPFPPRADQLLYPARQRGFRIGSSSRSFQPS